MQQIGVDPGTGMSGLCLMVTRRLTNGLERPYPKRFIPTAAAQRKVLKVDTLQGPNVAQNKPPLACGSSPQPLRDQRRLRGAPQETWAAPGAMQAPLTQEAHSHG